MAVALRGRAGARPRDDSQARQLDWVVRGVPVGPAVLVLEPQRKRRWIGCATLDRDGQLEGLTGVAQVGQSGDDHRVAVAAVIGDHRAHLPSSSS